MQHFKLQLQAELGGSQNMVGQEPIHSRERDRELMRLVARRDANAQQVLVNRLVRRIRKLTRLLLGNITEVDDAAQLALMEVLQSASRFRDQEDESLETWADRITVRTTLRLSQQLRNQRNIFERLNDQVHEALPSLQTSARGATDLGMFLGKLSKKRREAMVLKYALGYTVEEIAEITNVPTGTVKDRLIIAKRQLRQMVNREAKRLENASLRYGKEGK